MSIRDEAHTEAEIQFPARDPREGETTYPWSSIAVFKRRAFAMGYIAGANREHPFLGHPECPMHRPRTETQEPVAYALYDRDDGELVSVQRWPTGTEHVAFDVRPLYAAQAVRRG